MRARVLAGHPGMSYVYGVPREHRSQFNCPAADRPQQGATFARSELTIFVLGGLLAVGSHARGNGRGGRTRGTRSPRKNLSCLKPWPHSTAWPSRRHVRGVPNQLSRSRPRSLARISAPAAPPSEHSHAEFALKPAGPTPAGEITFRSAPGGRRKSFEQSTEPLPSRRQSVAFVRVELPGADHSGMAFTNLAECVGQPGDVRLNPAIPYQNGEPQNGQSSNGVSTPLAYQPAVPSLVFPG